MEIRGQRLSPRGASALLALLLAVPAGVALGAGQSVQWRDGQLRAGGGAAAGGYPGVLLLAGEVGHGSGTLRAYQPGEEPDADPLAADSASGEGPDAYRFGVDYLYGKSTLSLNYLNSSESDHDAQTFSLGLAHQAFGGLTTLKMGVGRGDDTFTRSADQTFEESVDSFNYTLGISQVLTQSLLMNVDYEAITGEGYLGGFDLTAPQPEVASGTEPLPGTRTSNAVSLRATKSWTPDVSTLFGYRYFWDSWDVRAHTWEAEYTNQLQNGWLVDLYYRFYTQEKASFYDENFARELSFIASERDVAAFASSTLGARLSYSLFARYGGLSRGTLNLSYEIIDYDDHFDSPGSVSSDPYAFGADSLKLFFSVRY